MHNIWTTRGGDEDITSHIEDSYRNGDFEMCELIFTGGRMIQSDESPTGWLMRLSASCNRHHRSVEPDGVREIRYECGVPVNPADGDDVARADFEAMDKLEKYHEEHCIGRVS